MHVGCTRLPAHPSCICSNPSTAPRSRARSPRADCVESWAWLAGPTPTNTCLAPGAGLSGWGPSHRSACLTLLWGEEGGSEHTATRRGHTNTIENAVRQHMSGAASSRGECDRRRERGMTGLWSQLFHSLTSHLGAC